MNECKGTVWKDGNGIEGSCLKGGGGKTKMSVGGEKRGKDVIEERGEGWDWQEEEGIALTGRERDRLKESGMDGIEGRINVR
jgi:hypothetical protein